MKLKSIAMFLFFGRLLGAGNAFAEPECLDAYGRTACGYNCASGYGQVKCASTPQGACIAAYGRVVCWDPDVRTWHHAECIAEYGRIKCGYNCAAGYGRVECGETPNVVCHAANGRVDCYTID